LGTTINLLNLFGENKERRVNLYLMTGVSALMFRSQATRISSGLLVSDYGYTTDGEKTNRETAFAIPLGGGLDFKLSERWYLNLETGIRLINSDKLDAIVSGSHNDAYYYTSLGVSFDFSRKEPKEKTPKEAVLEAVPATTAGGDNVNLIYDIPRELKSYDEFILKSEIHKGDIDGPAQLTQILPIGFDVLDTAIAGARTEFKNYTLNLHWDELPADSVFIVSYKVRLNKIYGTLPLNSVLYFEKTEKEYSFKTNVFIELFEPDAVVAVPIVVEDDVIEEADGEIIAEETVYEPIVEKEEEIPPENVEFRVQVRAAYKAKIPLQKLAGEYKLYAEIQENYIGNWYRYSVGSFGSYDEAKSYRNLIIGEHGVRDAFIVAFYEGKRLNRLSELKELAPEAYPYNTKFKENGTCYRVQMLALMKNEIDPQTLKEIYSIQDVVNEEVYHNWRKYTIGKCKTREEAVKIREEIVSRGVADAFIVVYKNGERVMYNGNL